MDLAKWMKWAGGGSVIHGFSFFLDMLVRKGPYISIDRISSPPAFFLWIIQWLFICVTEIFYFWTFCMIKQGCPAKCIVHLNSLICAVLNRIQFDIKWDILFEEIMTVIMIGIIMMMILMTMMIMIIVWWILFLGDSIWKHLEKYDIFWADF